MLDSDKCWGSSEIVQGKSGGEIDETRLVKFRHLINDG